MLSYKERRFQLILYGMSSIILVVLLAACQGDNGGGTSSATATPTSASTATSTLTPTATPIKVNLKLYVGVGYTIGYPAGWSVSTGTDGIVSFTDPKGGGYLAVTTQSNPQGAISATDLVDTGLRVFRSQAQNYQQLTVNPTTTVAGETWSQGAATGDITPTGQTTSVTTQVVVIADNHPPNSATTQGFTIAYGVDQQTFDFANQSYFQPMLQSFIFTS